MATGYSYYYYYYYYFYYYYYLILGTNLEPSQCNYMQLHATIYYYYGNNNLY